MRKEVIATGSRRDNCKIIATMSVVETMARGDAGKTLKQGAYIDVAYAEMAARPKLIEPDFSKRSTVSYSIIFLNTKNQEGNLGLHDKDHYRR